MGPRPLAIRAYDPKRDGRWAASMLDRDFGGRLQARRGELLDVLALPGLVATSRRRRVGLLTYRREGADCEVAFVAAVERRRGAGTALLAELLRRTVGCARIWLVTTNDNVAARRFYESRGFSECAVRIGAVDEARRRLKPGIPLTGDGGVPVRDEIEMELRLPGPA